MSARLAAAISAAVLAVCLSAGTADALQHKCDKAAGAVDEKCDDRTK